MSIAGFSRRAPRIASSRPALTKAQEIKAPSTNLGDMSSARCSNKSKIRNGVTKFDGRYTTNKAKLASQCPHRLELTGATGRPLAGIHGLSATRIRNRHAGFPDLKELVRDPGSDELGARNMQALRGARLV